MPNAPSPLDALRRPAVLLVALLLGATPLVAQARRTADPAAANAERSGDRAERAPGGRYLPLDTAVVSTHRTTIRGRSVPYRATVGTQPVYDRDGRPIASMQYTYYERTDVAESDQGMRPLVISFNGGPGTGSLWMHLGYTGPKRLKLDPEGFPIQPYGVEDNPYSLLDVADIVYLNPVNTGFSRALPGVDPKQFFGVNEDVEYLGDWITDFVSLHGRWESPKFLIGESYGTTRAAGLAGNLQGQHWMYLNGVILVSPTDLGVDRPAPVDDALNLPYMTATAWYHRALPADLQARDLAEILPEVERFTVDEYLPALARGGSLDAGRRREVAAQVARWSGLSEAEVMDHNLAIPLPYFWKALLRERGRTIGRLDSRYLGLDRENAGVRPDYNAELTSWEHSFTPAINYYLRDELGFETDLEYYVFGPVSPWNREGDRTGEMLRQAMSENPSLHLLVQSGYYDGGTPYFPAKYTLWQLDPGGRLSDRIRWEGYRSGHMLYLRRPDLEQATNRLREFIATAVADAARPSTY
jgi:carboxypeptidase C (cathepsin A)